MAFNLGDILVSIKANTDSLKKGISDVQGMGEQTKTLGQKIQTGLNTAAVGLAVVGAGLTVYAKKATDYTVDAIKSAKALGVTIGTTTTEASRLVAAVGRLGISAEDATQMFGIFSKQIVASTTNSEANRLATQKLQVQVDQTKLSIKQTTEEIAKNGDKTGELHLKLLDLNNTLATQQNALRTSADSFQKLGVSTVDGTGKQKDFNTILFEVADKFKTMPDGVDKTAIAMDLFGRSGKDMIKVLNQGGDGIKELEKRADELGLTLNQKTIGAVAALVESQKKLKEQTDAMKISVGTATAPVLTKFNEWILKVTQSALNAAPPIKGLTTNILAFGGPVASAASGTAGFLGNLSSIGPKLAQFLLKLGMWGAIIAAVGIALYELQVHFGIFDDLGGKLVRVWQYFNDLYGITTVLSQFWSQVMWPAIMAIWAAIYQNLWPALQQLWDSFMRLWNALQPGLLDALKILGLILGATLFAAVWLILAALNILIQVFSACVSATSNLINWVANLIGWFGNLVGVVVNTVASIIAIFRNIVPAFRDVVSVIGSLMGALGSTIVNAVKGFGSLLYNTGKDLVRGFINGIQDMLGSVKDAIGNVGSSAVNKMKSMLGIHSPSKVFADIGGNMGKGLVNGIMDSVGAVQDAINTLTSAPVSLAGGGVGVMPASGFLTGPQTSNSSTSNSSTIDAHTEINGPININSKQDADYFLARLDRNHQLEEKGLSPT
jgi:phage-related protein